jgi:hypothetical protein
MSADITALTAGGRTWEQWQKWLDTYFPNPGDERSALETAIRYAFHYMNYFVSESAGTNGKRKAR